MIAQAQLQSLVDLANAQQVVAADAERIARRARIGAVLSLVFRERPDATALVLGRFDNGHAPDTIIYRGIQLADGSVTRDHKVASVVESTLGEDARNVFEFGIWEGGTAKLSILCGQVVVHQAINFLSKQDDGSYARLALDPVLERWPLLAPNADVIELFAHNLGAKTFALPTPEQLR